MKPFIVLTLLLMPLVGSSVLLADEAHDNAVQQIEESGGFVRPIATDDQRVAVGFQLLRGNFNDSMLEPTANLINAVAAELAMRPEVRVHLVEGAWPLFGDGDLEGYYRVIAAAARELAGEADVLVLAQASMAPAKARIGELTASVLTSPEPGMARALALLCGPPT